jgi:hypothetical protein
MQIAIVQRLGGINRYASARQPAKVRVFRSQFNKDNTVYAEDHVFFPDHDLFCVV